MGPVRSLPQVKDKIHKYDLFLKNNKTELENRDLAASINSGNVGQSQGHQGRVLDKVRPGGFNNGQGQPNPSFSDQSSIAKREETLSNGEVLLSVRGEQKMNASKTNQLSARTNQTATNAAGAQQQ
jgi:hypothetical protein